MRKLSIWILSVLAIVCLPTTSFADRCGAEAEVANTKLITGHKYLFAFDVTSSECTKYSCRGYVHFVISYHYGRGSVVKDRTLVSYTIPRGNNQTHVALEHYVGSTDEATIDDVGVEEVSCSTP